MIGHTNPTGDNSGSGVPTTGPSEAAGKFPQLFVTSPNYGPGIQIKTKGINYSPRTIIGDGVFDGSGIGPSITQEFFAGTGYTFPSFLPLVSYNHKISNIANSGSTGRVFSITSLSTGGAYNNNTVAYQTAIETRNSNKRLVLMANGTGGGNEIIMGALNTSFLRVFGESGVTGQGGVTIGTNSNIPPVLVPLTGSNFLNLNNRHSLYVTGVQTIGTSDPISLFNLGVTGSGKPVGGNSLLKISRDLYSQTLNPSPGTLSATGFTVNNYPNGLEITSYISSRERTNGTANDSVAIAVGAVSQITGPTASGAANTTGFFVSNKGQNISIGQVLDSSAAIGVSGASAGVGVSDYAIKAKGDVGVTGDLEVVGDVGITGDLDLVGKGRIFQNNLTPVGNLTIPNGTSAMTTIFTIGPLDYDIVLYLSSENPYGKTLLSGLYLVQIVLGPNIVYFNRRGSDGTGTPANQRLQNLILNASVIVPAGVIAKVERETISVNIVGASPYSIGVSYYKMGR
jgi:hypothetical protein